MNRHQFIGSVLLAISALQVVPSAAAVIQSYGVLLPSSLFVLHSSVLAVSGAVLWLAPRRTVEDRLLRRCLGATLFAFCVLPWILSVVAGVLGLLLEERSEIPFVDLVGLIALVGSLALFRAPPAPKPDAIPTDGPSSGVRPADGAGTGIAPFVRLREKRPLRVVLGCAGCLIGPIFLLITLRNHAFEKPVVPHPRIDSEELSATLGWNEVADGLSWGVTPQEVLKKFPSAKPLDLLPEDVRGNRELAGSKDDLFLRSQIAGREAVLLFLFHEGKFWQTTVLFLPVGPRKNRVSEYAALRSLFEERNGPPSVEVSPEGAPCSTGKPIFAGTDRTQIYLRSGEVERTIVVLLRTCRSTPSDGEVVAVIFTGQDTLFEIVPDAPPSVDEQLGPERKEATTVPVELATIAVTPKVLYSPAPPNSPDAAIAGFRGKAVIEIVVEGGRVVETNIVERSPPFDMAALAAIVKWRYEPIVRSGEPIKWKATVTFDSSSRPQDDQFSTTRPGTDR